MRVVGKLCADAHNNLTKIIQPGITTLDIDRLTEEFFTSHGAEATFKGYRGYAYSLCTAVNDEVIHCVPTSYKLKDGDIITVDLGAKLDGFYADTAKTYMIGNVHPDVQAFVLRGYLALLDGIEGAKIGNHVSDITKAVYNSIKKHRYGVADRYGGHGIGRSLHEDPFIPNIPSQKQGAELAAGMVICIEPILTMYPTGKLKENSQWEIKTIDGSPAVHWEHTIAITETGPEILTLREEEYKNV
jgi:methionyl aminopeptidase